MLLLQAPQDPAPLQAQREGCLRRLAAARVLSERKTKFVVQMLGALLLHIVRPAQSNPRLSKQGPLLRQGQYIRGQGILPARA